MGEPSGLHVGLIGVGRIGAHHAATLAELDGVARLTLADADTPRARSVAGELGVEAAESPEALMEVVDAVAIATSTAGHVPMLELAVRAGVAAFCEKPVALELAPLDALVDEVERAGAFVQVGFQRRFDDGYRAARSAVAAGEAGTLLALRAATHDPSPPSQAYIATSGGIFRDLHIHDFDAIRFVTGDEIAEVYADGSVRETPWFAELGDVDTAAVVLRLSRGALAVVTGARTNALGYDVRLEVFGTDDSIGVGIDDGPPLHSAEHPTREPRQIYGDFLDRFAGAYRNELAAFVDAVRSGEPSPCTLGDARAALAVALAAERSRAERRPVSIEEVTGAQAVAG